MSSLNRVFVMGNLTKDPEVKSLGSGQVVADLRLAISDSYVNKKGEKIETVCYVDVATWGREAENCKQYLHKGSPVFVEGRLQLDTWEKDGQKRSKLKIKADHVEFLGGRGAEGRGEFADGPAPAVTRGASQDRTEESAALDQDQEALPFDGDIPPF